MDNRGYIFSTDAVLALVIFFVIAGSILTYYTLPSYLGADHQHLEAEADSALALLTSDGDLQAAIIKINSNDTQKQAEGEQLLNDKLSLILPSDVVYELNIGDDKKTKIKNYEGTVNPSDRVSRYSVLSAPNEGWLGRAWYKLEEVQFVEQRINTTQTLWNFHNFICKFPNWGTGSERLLVRRYWGLAKDNKGKIIDAPDPINFSIPDDARLKSAYFILGCQGTGMRYDVTALKSDSQKLKQGWNHNVWYPLNGDWNSTPNIWAKGDYICDSAGVYNQPSKSTVRNNDPNPSFGVNFNINNNNINYPDSSNENSIFKHIITRTDNYPVFNAKGDIPTNLLTTGLNKFYVEFLNASYTFQMPWCSILGEYETSIMIPEGINTDRFPDVNESSAYDCAGAAYNNWYVNYNISDGSAVKVTPPSNKRRQTPFTSYLGHDSIYADGVPFVLQKGSGTDALAEEGSTVARVYDVDLTTNNSKVHGNIRVVDAYTVVNTYGATDKVLIEVYNGDTYEDGTNKWHKVFYSNVNSGVENGYGNTPGTVYIGDYLRPNFKNKVRVTVWDDASGSGYDFVGLVDTYTVVSFTSLPIRWDNYTFDNVQSETDITAGSRGKSLPQEKVFTIKNKKCEKVMFFFGVGLDTTHVKLEVSDNNGKSETLYESDKIPFALDIGAIDADITHAEGSSGDKNLFAESKGGGNYTTKPGNYTAKLTVDVGPAWTSGDEWKNHKDTAGKADAVSGSAACEIFSGSRVAVIYPKFLENKWENAYSDTASDAQNRAKNILIGSLDSSFGRGNYKIEDIKTEALYTGDMPNNIPIRLDLWRS